MLKKSNCKMVLAMQHTAYMRISGYSHKKKIGWYGLILYLETYTISTLIFKISLI